MAVTEQDVDAFGYEQAMKLLDKEGICYEDLESLDELKDLIKAHLKNRLTPQQHVGPTSGDKGGRKVAIDSQRMMQEILSRDHIMKTELSAVYTELENFIRDEIGYDIKDVMTDMYDDYEATLASYKSELINDECPIVVAGETSAGKSSLLNLLLGTEVLPHSLLCATSTICRLHNCEEKYITIEKENGEIVTIKITEAEIGASTALRDKLKTYVSSVESRKVHMYKQVDIYWPIPMLQDRVTIVDTPGVGESEEITERLMSYLPNAVAFIYVINSAIAGGIQEDKLERIIREQQRWQREGRLTSFDYGCMIFVCNKWDRVEETSEEDKVWKDTITKVQGVLKDFPEEQIFKMSTTEAARYVKSDMGHTDKFQKLLEGIELMVPKSLKAKIGRHYTWLQRFLYKLQNNISSRINHARATEEEKRKLHDEVMTRLTKLYTESDKVKTTLTEKARTECECIVEELYLHLQDETVKERLKSWREEEVPDIEAGDLEVTQFTAEKQIMTKIQDEIRKWEKEYELIKKLSDNLTRLFKQECHVLGQECNEVDLMILGSSDCGFPIGTTNNSDLNNRDLSLFTKSEKVILAVAAPLWIPLVTAAAILFLPVGVGMFIRQGVIDANKRKYYKANKVQCMSDWTAEIIEKSFTKENLRRFIFDTYFESFKLKINEVCEDAIPKLILADQRQVNDIMNDRRTSVEILNCFLPIQRGIKAVLGKFQLYGLKHMTDDRIELKALEIEKPIGQGNFSDVYLAKWTKTNGEVLPIALKVLRRSLQGDDVYSQLTEVECLRKLKHPNIVEFYGVSYSMFSETENDSDGDPDGDRGLTDSWKQMNGNTLMLLLEFCDQSLEHKVFKEDEKLQCRLYDSVPKRKDAFKFYVSMAAGICDGLSHIHSKGFLHRDLKLSNVLIKDNKAKICDLGFARHEVATTGTFVGTLTHMSPELLNNKPYNAMTDIYSLGILLWELWYGRHAYSESEYESHSQLQLLDLIKSGIRPKLSDVGSKYKYQMTNELKPLVESCWNQEPKNRNDAAFVGRELRKMYKQYYNEEVDESKPENIDCVDSAIEA